MRKTKEVLRLRFELGLGQRQIARICGMGLGTVPDYLERATATGIGWPLPEGLSEEELEAKRLPSDGFIERAPQPSIPLHSSCGAPPLKHFYEKVVKVKADVAAILIIFFRAA